MNKQVIKLEDLSPDQLRAQVRLCFKFFQQCVDVLNGEEVSDDAVIQLVDPTGQSADLELFYKCKQVIDYDFQNAIGAIDKLRKENVKLRKRLAKKHDNIEELKKTQNLNFNAKKFCDGMKEGFDALKAYAENVANIAKGIEDVETSTLYTKMANELAKQLPFVIAENIAKRSIEAVEPRKRDFDSGISENTAKKLEDAFNAIRRQTSFIIPTTNPDPNSWFNQIMSLPTPKYCHGQEVYYMNGNGYEGGVIEEPAFIDHNKKVWYKVNGKRIEESHVYENLHSLIADNYVIKKQPK